MGSSRTGTRKIQSESGMFYGTINSEIAFKKKKDRVMSK